MKLRISVSHSWMFLQLISVMLTVNLSHAHQFQQPVSEILDLGRFHIVIPQWWTQNSQFLDAQIKLTASGMVAGVLCFIAAMISSAGGIGGGGLFIPILIIVARLDLKTASGLSAFMVTGGSTANVLCNLLRSNTRNGEKPLIDYDIALLSQPGMLLGVSIGVICNLMFPEWLITILFAVFLGWSTFKTCKSGVLYWQLESSEVERRNCYEKLTDGLASNEAGCLRNQGLVMNDEEPNLRGNKNCHLGIPWKKFCILILIWFSFFLLYLLRGNRFGQSIIPMDFCGVGYWIISSIQIPLAIIFTIWILCNTKCPENQTYNYQETEGPSPERSPKKLIFPIAALLAGVLGGVFGIGGGMLISPLLLQIGIAPEVTAGTCSFMVFFSSSMSAAQYLLLGMEHINKAIIFAIISFVASLFGLMMVQRAISKHGRASLIVFSVGTVVALSTVIITSFGVIDIWRKYTNGEYMGFKQPC